MKTRKERAGVCRILRSQRGASILFALFLFLICAVVGSVVLTAGTAAAGRRSQIAKVDQRYYSVGSAEEVVRSLIEEQTVTIVREKKTTEHTTYELTKSEDGSSKRTGIRSKTSEDPTYAVYLDGSSNKLITSTDCESSILVDAAASLIPSSSSNAEAAYTSEIPAAIAEPIKKEYQLTHSGTDPEMTEALKALTVDMTTTLKSTNGIAYLDVTFSVDGYSLTDTFRLQLTEVESTESSSSTPVVSNDVGNLYLEKFDTDVTETTTDSFRWVFEKQQIVQNEE